MGGVVALTDKGFRRLVLLQSVLVALQTVAAASILGDVIGPKPAALFIVVVAGAQQGVAYFQSKTASDSIAAVAAIADRADAATAHASQVATTVAAHLADAVPASPPGQPGSP